MAAPSKQEVRAWCRMCYGADWHQNNKAARLAEARAALSVPSNFSAPYLGTASRATTTAPSAPKQHKATSQMTTSSRNAAPKQKMTSSQHSNDGGGKMKAMPSSKTVRLLQEDLLKEMSRGDGEGGRTEFIMDILQRLDEVDINLKILSETLIGATVMKLKKDDGVAISVSNTARKLIKKWKSVAEKAEANATTKTDVALKSTNTSGNSGVLNRSTVAKSKASKGNNVASTKGVLTSQDLSSSSTTHKTIAAKMLSLLPHHATRQDAAAKKLIKAFPLLLAELDVRSREMTRASESAGTRLPFAFRFLSEDNIGNNGVPMDAGGAMHVIHVPEECFVKIMTFLNGCDIVNASTVCKAWLYVSRMPVLWERFAVTDGLSNKSKKLNMTSFLALLERPQFASLKYLSLPYKVKLGKNGIKSIARVCPHLETWEVGFLNSGKQTDNDLIEAVEHFPNLTSIHTGLFDVTNFGIISAARTMGAQLIDLRIRKLGRYLSDSVIGVIAEHCPNLKHFAYILPFYRYYKPELDMLSGVGLTQLVRGCRRLEVLKLDHALQITREDFVAILSLIEQGNAAAMNGDGEFSLHKISLKGYPFVIGDKPFSIVDTGTENPFQSFAHVDGDDVDAHEGDEISDED